MSDSMFEIEHKPEDTLTIRFRPPKMRNIAPEAREHIKAARKELLLGIRSVIDMAIEMTEKVEEKPTKSKRTKIDIE